jgi:hypothetical protein
MHPLAWAAEEKASPRTAVQMIRNLFMVVSPKRGFENNRGWSSSFRQRTTGAEDISFVLSKQ